MKKSYRMDEDAKEFDVSIKMIERAVACGEIDRSSCATRSGSRLKRNAPENTKNLTYDKRRSSDAAAAKAKRIPAGNQ